MRQGEGSSKSYGGGEVVGQGGWLGVKTDLKSVVVVKARVRHRAGVAPVAARAGGTCCVAPSLWAALIVGGGSCV